jgi:hypothetical protein
MPSRLAGALAGLAAAGALAGLVACEDPAKNVSRAPAAPTSVAAEARPGSAAPGTAARPAAAPLTAPTDDESLHRAAPQRIVAIGDLHGDLARAQRAFRLGGAIDEKGSWVGGDLVVVQVGDQIDRGDDDRAILDWLARLKIEARDAGGDVVSLLGNHEIMNAQLDFRYVTPGSLPAFSELGAALPPRIDAHVPHEMKGRAAAFFPGGPYALRLASQPIAGWVGQNLFAHGGILPKHVREGLAKIDRDTDAWLRGERPKPPASVVGEDGIVWTRLYSAAPGPAECRMLDEVLRAYGAKRMIVGHTVQRGGIAAACDGKVWRVDCGMSRFYGGPVQVLQIRGDETVVLKDDEP